MSLKLENTVSNNNNGGNNSAKSDLGSEESVANLKERMEALNSKNKELQALLYVEKQSNTSLQAIIQKLKEDLNKATRVESEEDE